MELLKNASRQACNNCSRMELLKKCIGANLQQFVSNGIVERMHRGKLAASSAATPRRGKQLATNN